jgi:hypothetical protein
VCGWRFTVSGPVSAASYDRCRCAVLASWHGSVTAHARVCACVRACPQMKVTRDQIDGFSLNLKLRFWLQSGKNRECMNLKLHEFLSACRAYLFKYLWGRKMFVKECEHFLCYPHCSLGLTNWWYLTGANAI